MGSEEREMELVGKGIIDPKRGRFPYCIVWSPLPVVSWFFPCIGHVGICREDGVILDFAGPNFVCVDHFTFGAPTRYIQLTCKHDEIEIGGGWDDALRKSTLEYQHHSYNIFTCNCHSFVSNCLNNLKKLELEVEAGLLSSRDWNVVNLALLMFLKARFVSKAGGVRTYLPFILVTLVGFGFGGFPFLAYLALCLFLFIAWFLLATYCFKNAIRV